MSTTTQWQARAPELVPVTEFPSWFHHHGTKMRLGYCNHETRTLKIASSAASLKISATAISGMGPCWKIEWRVLLSQSEKSEGTRILTYEQLAIMFNLKTGEVPTTSQWLIDRYGGDYAHQSHFIRWNDFLNIPCPGTGHDGDPNISLLIDTTIQRAVAKLLE